METPSSEQRRCVFRANGELQAQQVRSFLEAAGITCEFRGEALRNTRGLTVDGLGMVAIYVPEATLLTAR